MNQAVIRVLAVSRDRSGLDSNSRLASRWKKLTALGVDLEVWILAAETTTWEVPGLKVSGTGGRTIVHRLLRASRRKPAHIPHLVTTQDMAELGLIGLHLAKRFNAKLEVQDHGGWFDGSTSVDEPFWWIRIRLARWLIRRADSIRTVNPASFEWLKQHTSSFVYWLPIVPRDTFRTLERKTIPEQIISVARLVSVKRQDLLLRSFAEVIKQRPQATLVLVGDGPERSRLESLSQALGLADRIQFIGAAQPESYLKKADVFAWLSSHEGWGVAPVEAAMVGIPVVTSNTGAAAWLAAQGAATVVTSQDPIIIAQALIQAFGKGGTRLQGVLNADETAVEQVSSWRKILSL